MFLELAIADAYAAGFFHSAEDFLVSHNNLTAYQPHNDCLDSTGFYTGITQGNIAIAKMLIQGHPWVKEYLANSLWTTYKQDPRQGYGDKLDKLLQKATNARELLDMVDCYGDLDYPALRSMAIGKLSTPEKVFKASMVQGAITNNNPDSLNAAIAVALMCHFFIYNLGKKSQLLDFLNIYLVTDWLQSSKSLSRNLSITKTAVELTIEHQSLSQLLQHCISLNKDSSPIAAIAVAAASCSQEYQQDLPQCLWENLENHTQYGRDYLINLDRQWQKL